jgi:hypothetical protein
MPTNVAGSKAQRHHLNVPKVIDGTVTFDTAGVATGVEIGILPAGAQIIQCLVNVETAFNAASTNVLVVGYGASLDEIVAAGGVDESSATAQAVATGLGLEHTVDRVIKAKYTQTGTAATAGRARIVIVYSEHEKVY